MTLDAVKRERRREAESAAAILGVDDIQFLDLGDYLDAPKEDLALQGDEFRNSAVRKFSGTAGIGKLAYDFISSTLMSCP